MPHAQHAVILSAAKDRVANRPIPRSARDDMRFLAVILSAAKDLRNREAQAPSQHADPSLCSG
jgi:hypothetical protein